MSPNLRVRLAVQRALLASMASLVALPAFAQDQAAAVSDETIVVTGTRIQRRDYEATSPIATVSAEAIQATGELNTEAVLNTLTQVVPAMTCDQGRQQHIFCRREGWQQVEELEHEADVIAP